MATIQYIFNPFTGNFDAITLGGSTPTFTSFTLTNNQATPADVTGFLLNSATNNGFVADFSILRTMTNVPPVGNLDLKFNTSIGSGFNSAVQALAVDPSDSSIIVGGGFTSFDTTSINRIAKLNYNGTENTTFTTNVGGGFNDTVRAAAIDSTGRILIGGSFITFDGNTRRKLVCLSSAGVEDATFTANLGTKFPTGAPQYVAGIGIQSNDAVVAVGNFATFNGGNPARVIRLNSDGTEDTTFSTNVGSGLDASAEAVIIQADSKILIGGSFTTLKGGAVAPGLVRLNSDGTEDTAFTANLGTGFDSTVLSVVEQADHKLVISGSFVTFNGNTRNRLVRLNADGTEDTTFYTNLGTAFNGSVQTTIVQAGDGKIFVGGGFTDFNGNGLPRIVRLNADGTEDTAFTVLAGTGPDALIVRMTAKPSGAVLAGGAFTAYNGVSVGSLLQFDVVEELDQVATFYGAYSFKNAAWMISDPIGAFDDAGVTFSITAGGQLQYTSTDMLGTVGTQEMRFLIGGL